MCRDGGNSCERRGEAWSVLASRVLNNIWEAKRNGTWGRGTGTGNADGKRKRKMKNRNKRENGYWSYKVMGLGFNLGFVPIFSFFRFP